MSSEEVAVRLVFADRGMFQDLVIRLPREVLDRYERLIDVLREEPTVTARIYIDPRRLVAAYLDSDADR